MKTQKKPTEICNTHCQWFWPKEDKSNCQTVCSSAGYLLGEEEPDSTTFRITNIEKKILKLLAAGKTRKAIREELNMAPDTLRKHFEVMRGKAKLLEDIDDEPIVDEKDVLGVKGMHVVDDISQVDRNVYYERFGKGKIKRIDGDL